MSSDLIRVHTRTHKVTVYKAPLPDCGRYHAVVDAEGQVWTVCHSVDYLRRFDPKTERWTRYDIPTLSIDAHGMATILSEPSAPRLWAITLSRTT